VYQNEPERSRILRSNGNNNGNRENKMSKWENHEKATCYEVSDSFSSRMLVMITE
jgi:hypothetical protein